MVTVCVLCAYSAHPFEMLRSIMSNLSRVGKESGYHKLGFSLRLPCVLTCVCGVGFYLERPLFYQRLLILDILKFDKGEICQK